MSKSWHPEEPDKDYAWPSIRARGQRHRDAPLSKREKKVWLFVWIALAALAVALITYMATR